MRCKCGLHQQDTTDALWNEGADEGAQFKGTWHHSTTEECHWRYGTQSACSYCRREYTGSSLNPANVGVKHDTGKDRWDLLPFGPTSQVVKVLTWAVEMKGYPVDNWRLVKDWRRRYFAAGCRHLTKWILGEKLDPESGLHHLAHAACCILFLLELDDGGS